MEFILEHQANSGGGIAPRSCGSDAPKTNLWPIWFRAFQSHLNALWFLIKIVLDYIWQGPKYIYAKCKLFVYAQYYLFCHLCKRHKPVANVEPWRLTLTYLEGEWVRLVRTEREGPRPILGQLASTQTAPSQGPLSPVDTAAKVYRDINNRLEQEKGFNFEEWAVPSVEELVKQAVGEVLLNLEDLSDHFPTKGLAYYNAGYIEFLQKFLPAKPESVEELDNFKQSIDNLLYADAIQTFIKLHKKQIGHYRTLLMGFSRIYLEKRKDINKLCDTLTHNLRQRKQEVESMQATIQKEVNYKTASLWERLNNTAQLVKSVQTNIQARADNLDLRVTNCYQTFTKGHKMAQAKIHELEKTIQALKEDMANCVKKVEENEDLVELFAPEYDSDIDSENPPDQDSVESIQEGEQSLAEAESENQQPIILESEPEGATGGSEPTELQSPYKEPATVQTKHIRSAEAKKRRRERYRAAKAVTPHKTPTHTEHGEEVQQAERRGPSHQVGAHTSTQVIHP